MSQSLTPSTADLLEALHRLGGECTTIALLKELQCTAVLWVHIWVDDLEALNYVSSRSGPATPERGNRPTRIVTLTHKGLCALEEYRSGGAH